VLRYEGKAPAGQALPGFTAEPSAAAISVLRACCAIKQLRSTPCLRRILG
jgi:hypothetical protein